jgi:hypothetical protein
LIARHIFFSYSAALRWWLAASENPDWRSGMRDFAVILNLQTTGLGLRHQPKQDENRVTVSTSGKGRAKAARTSTNGRLNAAIVKANRTRPLESA